MTLASALTFLGKVDGAIAAGALGFATAVPADTHGALVVAGVAGGLGVILNAIAAFAGLGPVAPTSPPPAAKG